MLKDKRRKLVETWQRVLRHYEKDDVEQYVELKRLWHSYNNRKAEVMQHFESVRNAENVMVEEIPLPSAGGAADTASLLPDAIPLPPGIRGIVQPKSSILKKPSVL